VKSWKVRAWFDAEGDFLEVRFSDKAGFIRETNNDAVMERVDEQGNTLGLPLPSEWIAELAEHAEVVYHHNRRFRQLLGRPANTGRDWLHAFTRHWLWAILASRRPHLLSRLPPSFAIGRGTCSALLPTTSALPAASGPAETAIA